MSEAVAIKKLALSGGGFRATLFHLGVIRYLCETGRLEEITHIASVSGGSILAAHLVMNWSDYKNKDPKSFGRTAKKIIDFVQRDVRGRVFRFWLFARFFPTLFTLLFAGLLLWSFPGWWLWIGSIAAAIFLLGCTALVLGFRSRTALLQREYRRQLFKRPEQENASKSILERLLTREYWQEFFKPNRMELRDLEGNGVPTLIIAATNLTTGDLCSFQPTGFHWMRWERTANGATVADPKHSPAVHLSVEFAVAASSAFPPAFPPVRLPRNKVPAKDNNHIQTDQFLTDGGVYENLGIQAISSWAEPKEGGEVLVSDAERPFGWVLQEWSRFRLVLPRATRASDILMRRLSEFERDQRKDWIYIRLQDSAPGFTEPIQDLIRKTRTDLDRFTPLEIQCLVYQGYAAAHHALGGNFSPHLEIRNDCPQVKTENQKEGWLPFASVNGKPAHDLEKSQRMSVFWNIFTPSLFSPFALLILLFLGVVGTVWLQYQRRTPIEPTGLNFHVEKLDKTLSREGTEGPTKDVFQALGTSLDNPQHFRAETQPLGSYTEDRPCERFLCRISNTNSTLRIVFYLFRMKKTEKGEIWEYLDKADLNKAQTGNFTVPASDPDHYLVLLGCADLFGEPNRKKIDSSLKVEVGHAR